MGMRTIVVTGGAGFVGANFIYYLLAHHPANRIVCADCLTYAGNLSTLTRALAHPHFRFYRTDICDRAAVDRLFAAERPDVVVNFAAESHVDRSIVQPEVFLRTNILGAATLMDACLAHGVTHFHQVSTDEVYGDLPLDAPGVRFTEHSPLRASSPYSSSKASADLLALAYHRTYGLPVTISRCSNNYGPYQFPEKLVPLMTIRAMQGGELPVYGTGRNVRDWLHVEDHCRALDLILDGGRDGEIYNVGGGSERANLDVVRMICREVGCSERHIVHVPDRKGHDLRYALDAAKLREQLGWAPRISFEDGLRATLRWYRDNRSWWEDILSGRYRERNASLCEAVCADAAPRQDAQNT